jgi:hypothetical protein
MYQVKSELQLPFFHILDIRNFTWVSNFEPEQPPTTTVINTPPTNPVNPPNLIADKSEGKLIGIIIGTVGLSIGIGTVAGILGYKFYKKQKYNRAIPTAGGI